MQNLGFLAIFAPIIAFWQSFKSLGLTLFSFFIREDSIKGYSLCVDVFKKISKTPGTKVYYWGNSTWLNDWRWIAKYKISDYVWFQSRSYLFVLYKGKIPLIIKSSSTSNLTIKYITFLFDAKKLFEQTITEFYELARREREKLDKTLKCQGQGYDYRVVRAFSMDGSDRRSSISAGNPAASEKPSIDVTVPSPSNGGVNAGIFGELTTQTAEFIPMLALTSDDIQYNVSTTEIPAYWWSPEGSKVLETVKHWLCNRDWFGQRSIAWRHGVCLYGAPGTGKSALVKKIAETLQMPVVAFDLNGMGSTQFADSIQALAPGTIVLLEDFDCVFDKRRNVSTEGTLSMNNPLTLDTILNLMAGVQTTQGLFWVVTTNHIEKLDPALLRPGRLDELVEIPKLTEEGRITIAHNILRDWPELADELVVSNPDATAAEFEHACIAKATEQFWNQKKDA